MVADQESSSFQQQLVAGLRPVRRRLQWQRTFRASAAGLLVGSSLACCLVPIADSWTSGALITFAVPLAACVALGMVAWTIRIPWTVVAQQVDRRYGLKDRVFTAWDFVHRGRFDAYQRLQLRDAIEHLNAVDPTRVHPWRTPRWAWFGMVVWACSLGMLWLIPSGVAQETPPRAEARAMETARHEMAERIEEDLMSELRRLAELTGTPPPDQLVLDKLRRQLEDRLTQLREPDGTQDATLATLSAMQTELDAARQQFASPELLKQLGELSAALGTAAELEGVQMALDDQDFVEAAARLEAADLTQLSELERQTLVEDLNNMARSSEPDPWAEAIRDLQQALDSGEELAAGSESRTSATQKLAERLRQQAARLAIQAELGQQIVALAEAKGMGTSGGDNTDPSNRSRETWGRGRAGDPLSGQPSDLNAQRVREQLTGRQGEGPSQRQMIRSDDLEGSAQRQLQATRRARAEALEAAIANELLPLGQRQTIRRYFQSIRPDAAAPE